MVDIVQLPSCPPPTDATISPIWFATDLQGPLGGPTQRVLRAGSRMRAELTWPPMTYDDARKFIARLLRAEASPIAVAVPQRGLKPVSPGALKAVGYGSPGLLGVQGGRPNFILREGQFFSLSSGGRRWLHNLQQDVVLDGGGRGVLPINPLLRVPPAAGDATEWVAPMIEGFVDLGSVKWTLELLVRVGLSVAVTEDR